MSSDGEDLDSAESVKQLVDLGLSLIEAILACKPLADVKTIIDAGAPLWFQDDDGWSPLHAAASTENEELISLLISEGAPWNSVDNLGNSPGDIALSLNNEECYTLIRDAGLRSEIILQLLASHGDPPGLADDTIVLKAEDDTAMGSTAVFLSSRLRYTVDENGQEICMLKSGEEEVGVMMGWEREIMQETVKNLCEDHGRKDGGLKVLNVGFGLGIIDSFFQQLLPSPSLHAIIEPHPDVLQHMRDTGWYDKPGVKIFEGKWQDVLRSEAFVSLGGFDAVYTDTFSEDYETLHQFFKKVPSLLANTESRFSFFNGLGATNAVFYDVYTKLADINLAEIGIELTWEDVDVAAAQGVDRWGQTREYFAMRLYRLPVGRLKIG
ncbi:hypothetical protein OF83DRAFT_1066264 [Amylostereum chailletii]|nr:hypothetical protein OF83DRAFT_1066264 [Amylostereum chailletii]